MYRERFPEKQFLIVLDNFHNLKDRSYGGSSKRREQIIDNVDRLKQFIQACNVPVITTAELRKVPPGKRPTEDDISETGTLYYRCDICLMLHNDLTENPRSDIFWEGATQDGHEKKPVLEIRVRKNKWSSFKDWWFFRYDPEYNFFKQFTDPEQIKQMREKVLDNLQRAMRQRPRNGDDE
jgi:replicative DNA helicase